MDEKRSWPLTPFMVQGDLSDEKRRSGVAD